MSFISVFDVLGPNMIGPSSSHTAGAAKVSSGWLDEKSERGRHRKPYGRFPRMCPGF